MNTVIKASCHCGLNAFNIAFATDSLPVSGGLCHCTACRHTTGQLMASYVGFIGVPLSPTSTSEPADLSNLTPYKTSSVATRWFCSKCSAHILWEYNNTTILEPSWRIAVGSLQRTEGIINSAFHAWIGDTLDGGIADHLISINGIELPRYKASATSGEVVPAGWNTLSTNATPDADDRLHAYCHCKANSFYVTRPSAASTAPFSPYPDVTHAQNNTPDEITLNPSDEKWWLRPAGATQPTKYLGGHCACTSCRTASGNAIQSWAFIPCANIITTRGDTGEAAPLYLQDREKRPAGLRHYKSNPGRNREFCPTCGATIFWWGEERPDLVDLSVGLADEQQAGTRAEGWIEFWKQRISFEEDAISRDLVR
ncbi:hypothetical protein DXG01_014990, partial [Tephrocybe rancida]